MIVEFTVILDSMCMLVEGRERQCGKGIPSSRDAACAKPLEKEGEQYILGTERRSIWLEIEERKEWDVGAEAQDEDRSRP